MNLLCTQPNTPVGGDKDQWVTIRLLQTDKKEHILRGAKVDRVIKWINLLSLVSVAVLNTWHLLCDA